MNEGDGLEQKQAVLDYWTLVEFFSPYLLENVLDSKQRYQRVYDKAISEEPLPWITAPILQEDDLTSPFAKGYNLYLGLFSIEETADRARHVFAKEPSEWQSVNWRGCGASNSITCFARITITIHGMPLYGTLSLSTLPWAHGQLLKGTEEFLTLENYWKSVNKLIFSLREEFSRQLEVRLVKRPDEQASFLDHSDILKLVQLLYDWAGYKPLGYPVALIEPLGAEPSVAAKDPLITTGKDVPILNSFYIQDLESAKVTLGSQNGMPLATYLSCVEPPCVQSRISLESEEGKKAILSQLRPAKTTAARWPDPLSQQQSLMQQFAINASFEELKEKGVFSVNGPPGTGKTSLLREIIAENIVSRAIALSKFKTAQGVFVERHSLNFEGGDPIIINELDPSLLGYEMLVVSSNNAAVQNLSQELPLSSQLDPLFQHASYLKEVALKAFGFKEQGAWGLISATLGNAENCRRFVENVFISHSESKHEKRIWEWIDDYKGLSFAEAKEVFTKLKERQESFFEELEMLASLHDEMGQHTIETYCEEFNEALIEINKQINMIRSKLLQLAQDELDTKELLSVIQERELLWRKERPKAIVRVINRKAFEVWSEKSSQLRKERLAALEELQSCKLSIKELRLHLQELAEQENDQTEKFLDRALLFCLQQNIYEKLKKRHEGAQLPDVDEERPSHSYYQTEEVNALRSELFIAAMALHEAWLAEVCRPKGGFRGNLMAISNVLQGKNPTTSNDTILAWQSVFLFIPVISSTFASIGRLFRYMEPKTLGWVLIDEAGQALPQAIVGAIWRAKRVLSIGDPFQIEPICTVPAEVVDGMAKRKLRDYTLSLAPSQISAQNLMDRASIYGSHRTVRDESYWLGSPLRVHRRCLEPMFSIANAIAYENSMLLATEPEKEGGLPPSCWWDVVGQATERQCVPEQVNALIHLLQDVLKLLERPDVFIISPFREVVLQVKHRLIQNKALNQLFEKKFPSLPIQKWAAGAIGTVHTFQGKQTAVVFFLLGADKTNLGAIQWASRKPNLLNVAVTRAKNRLYIIGDYDL